MGLVATPTAINKAGKKAKNKLNAMACEIMLQRGKTLANMLNARLETAADAIIVRHYTRAADFPKAPLPLARGCVVGGEDSGSV